MTLSSVPVHTLSQHSIPQVFASFLLLPLVDTLIFSLGPQAKPNRANWSLQGYTASFFTVPELVPSSAAESGPFLYGQTAGARVRADCVGKQFLKRGVKRCDYKKPTQGTEGLKSQ